jgi:four helix bundle protein
MIKLIELEVYKSALEIGDKVWEIVNQWDYFNKDTLGKQFVRAADSMALNIAEGYGRYFYKENKNFNYYSRGSAFESTSCLRKALNRKLISDEENVLLRQLFSRYFRLMNGYIKSIGNQNANDMNEEQETYQNGNDLEDLMTNDPMTG